MNDLKEKTILITGATGLIGQAIIKELLKTDNHIKIIALVRNRERAYQILGKETENLKFYFENVETIIPQKMNVDYIIHAASQTSSKLFVANPVETSLTALVGTKNMLDIARLSSVEGFVYLSSMEVYGAPTTDDKIFENHNTNLDTMKVRSCYPESKRMCENLCVSYASEYNVPAKVIRLTQTFGPGVRYDDGRVFAEFARCVIEKKDIILNTKGETKRSYLYTEDAAKAIITILKEGISGEAYNVANEDTYCSIYEMALLVAQKCAHNKISVKIKENTNENLGYAPVLHMNLDTSKIRKLGWKPSYGLEEMFEKMIDSMKMLI